MPLGVLSTIFLKLWFASFNLPMVDHFVEMNIVANGHKQNSLCFVNDQSSIGKKRKKKAGKWRYDAPMKSDVL